MIEIIPAIDLIEGRCVRLTKGDYSTKKVYDADPLDLALAYRDCAVRRIHLVDLDGARVSSPCNLRTLEKIAGRLDIEIEWGGGISSPEALRDVFNAGASHAIIGSVAALRPDEFVSWMELFGSSSLILGADVRGRKVSVKGWAEDSARTIDELLDFFAPKGLQEVICTDISRDGMLQGPNTALYSELQSQHPSLSLTVSGGISCMDDIRRLDEESLRKVIVGKAIYENRITLNDILQWSQNE